MKVNRAAVVVVVLLLSLLLALLAPATTMSPTLTVDARSSGLLDNCDNAPLTVTGGGTYTWQYGYIGANLTLGRYGAIAASQRSSQMTWAWWPLPSNYYTLRTSDSSTPASDVTYYTPDRWTELHLRVQDLRRKWIGMSLYATTGIHPTNKKHILVGEWMTPTGARFQVRTGNISTGTGCTANSGSVVTHIDADLKPLHTRFYFRAPVGTGKVTFRLLIKQGEQNHGSFFYLPVDLSLNEGASYSSPVLPSGSALTSTGEPVLKTDNATQYVIGTAGKACAEVCLSQTPATPYCHFTKTQQINSASVVSVATAANQISCNLPYMQGCIYNGAGYIDATGNCYWRGDITSCPRVYQTLNQTSTPPPNVCFSRAGPTNRPLCVCSNERASQPINPYQKSAYTRRRLLSYQQSRVNEGEEYVPVSSAAGGDKFGLSSMIVALITLVSSMMSKSSRSMIFLVICFVLLAVAQPTSAHNYIKGLHRAREAAVAVPCQQRIGNQPHVQVIRNQTFEIEWSLGHGDNNYKTPITGEFWFAIVHEDDYDKLAAANILAIVSDYLDRSFIETGVNASVIPVGWNKVHLHNKNEDALSTSTISQYFDIWNLSKTAPEYVPRDSTYMNLAHPSQYGLDANNIESRFLPQYTAWDKRASYKSAKYPWLEHVTYFYNHIAEHSTVVNQADLARFAIPSWVKSGNHVLYFNWLGYKDCVDLNIVDGTTPVKKRYGDIPSPNSVTNTVKFDHCEFNYIGSFWTQCRKVDKVTMDASACIQDCQKVYGCTHVQVVRVTNPANTLWAIPNYPVNVRDSTEDPGNKCFALRQEDRFLDGCPTTKQTAICNMTAKGFADDDYMCFGTVPLRNQDLQVEEDFAIATDWQEPSYYSTCFFLAPDRNFIGIDPIPTPPPSWTTGESCVPCSYYNNTVLKVNATQAPLWANGGITTTCQPCDQAMSQASIATWDPQLNGADLTQAGRKDAQTLYPPTSSPSSTGGTSSSTAASSTTTSSTAISSTAQSTAQSSTATSTAQSSTTKSSTAQSSTATSSTAQQSSTAKLSSTATSSTVQSSTATASSTSTSSTTQQSSTAKPSTATSSTGTLSSSGTTSSLSTGATVETQAIKMTVRLNIDWNIVDSEVWKTTFVNSVASALRVAASRIKIVDERLVTSSDASKRASSKRSSSRSLLQTTSSAVDLDFMILPSDDGSGPGPTVASATQDFKTQLTTTNSPLMMSAVGSSFDKTVAAQQVGVSQCPNGAYVIPCPSTGDDNTGDDDDTDPGNSSSSGAMTLALIIVGTIIGVLILGAIIFFIVKSCATSSAKQTAMNKMAAESHDHRSECDLSLGN